LGRILWDAVYRNVNSCKSAGDEDIVLSLFKKRGFWKRCHVSRFESLGRLARWIVLLKTIMASIGSPTDEAPLQPEIHSIASLATAHTQKVYFSGTARYRGPGAPDYLNLWVQLTGTIISVGQQDEKISLPSVNAADAVRPPFCLLYLCDSAKPSSLVHRSRRGQ
jgi:hypothetical protein